MVCTLGPDLRIERRAIELTGSLKGLWPGFLTTYEGPPKQLKHLKQNVPHRTASVREVPTSAPSPNNSFSPPSPPHFPLCLSS